MKLTDLAECEREEALLDKDGTVLCSICKKRPAIVTPYGMLRRCKLCEKRDIRTYWNYGDGKFK